MTRVEKISEEIAKTKVKMTEIQNKLRDLERQKKEAENVEIILAIRSGKLSDRELSALTKRFQQNTAPTKKETEEKTK